MFEYSEIKCCRLCQSTNLTTILNCGNQYVVNFIQASELHEWIAGKHEHPIPLVLSLCENCKYVQLRHSVNPDRLYRKFWYLSGVNESMCRTLKEIVDEGRTLSGAYTKTVALDIGSNDGTLLSFYDSTSTKVGFDPAENLTYLAKCTAQTPHIFADYFTPDYSKHLKVLAPNGFDVITAISMFYDLENPKPFLTTVKDALAPNGVFIIQMNYLLSMLEQNAVDNIAHEHLGYYSLGVLINVLKSCGLRVHDAAVNDVNGGSIRVFITKEGFKPDAKATARVAALLAKEAAAKLDETATYEEFGKRVGLICSQIRQYINRAVSKTKTVYLYGASTRGSTLMQMVVPQRGTIRGAAERNPDKYGYHMIGTWIPIVSEEEASKHADVYIVLPWHFKRSILDREEAMMLRGVELMFPLPTPRVYTMSRVL